jgi:hypothetical protein
MFIDPVLPRLPWRNLTESDKMRDEEVWRWLLKSLY